MEYRIFSLIYKKVTKDTDFTIFDFKLVIFKLSF